MYFTSKESCRRNLFFFLCAIGAACLICVEPAAAHQIKIDGRTFTLPDGFTIERVAGPPVVNRPIQGDFDEFGNLYMAESSGSSDKVQKQLEEKPHHILKLAAADAQGIFHTSSVFADHLMFPEGAMWEEGSLYVGAPPSIWKLTDITGQGIADQRIEWFSGKTLTGCANDIHGPYAGPDGWIYWCKGAFAEQTYILHGNKKFVTRAAHIFRARPDGSGIEPVMTGGMDNPVHVVFMPNGERFFTTTFLQNPAGGQRDGIIHAIYGGIYGKVHDVIEDHPHTSPDVMPVLVQLGPAAACGLARYESDAFGPEYRNNLFASSFNLRKITRHILTPSGATYSSKDEDFLVCDDLDFHPTDIIEDADGSLLIVDTGGWYKLCCPTSQLWKPDVLGAIYRIRRSGAPQIDDPRGLKLDWKAMTSAQLAALLGDHRPAVRKRAIEALAARGPSAIQPIETILRTSSSQQARLDAVWAATRIDSPEARSAVRLALHDADDAVRQAAAHSASVWRDSAAFDDLIAVLQYPSAFNRRVAAEALGRLGNAKAIPAIFQQLARDNDRVLDHSLTYALIEIDDPSATSAGLASDNTHVKRSAMIALDQMDGGKVGSQIVASAMNASDRPLRETAAWIASRHPDWGDQLADAMRKRMEAANLSEVDQQQLIAQLSKLAASPAIQNLLIEMAGDSNASPEIRNLSLSAIGQSDLKQTPGEWVAALSDILDHAQPTVLLDTIHAAGKLHLSRPQRSAMAQKLIAVARRDDLPTRTRLEALEAIQGGLPAFDSPTFLFLVAQLANDQPADQQLMAAQALSRGKLSVDQLLDLTRAIETSGPLEIGPLMDAFQQTTNPKVGQKLVDSLGKAKSLTSLHPDVLRARLAPFGEHVIQQGDALLAKLDPDATQQKQKLDAIAASLPSGDIRRGQLIFNGTKAACVSCHAIGYVGAQVGPDLTRVGATRKERDLLESIVFPSASFVQSYQPTAVQLRSGTPQYGIIKRDDAAGLVLLTGPNQEVHIPRDQIKAMQP
ncbi:MAG TPA: PVC-type heme-binding CxxCH protein, partial [Tepidisphaeraceae bacterium]|nr:PVC-type heme-binding CxxCH protein [Tepidisphaeraceae bacterium]